MVVQCLYNSHDDLAAKNGIPALGWTKESLSWVLEVDETGRIVGIYSVRVPNKKGTKMLPISQNVPARARRSSNIAPYFLVDNASYILGVEDKDKKDDAGKRFEAAKQLHERILGPVESDAAKAVLAFFRTWDPQKADECAAIVEHKKDLLAGGNITFLYNGSYVLSDRDVCAAWKKEYNAPKEGTPQICLVTGESAVPEAVFPAVRQIAGSDKAQMAICSFNQSAFESYGKHQGFNAPMSKSEAYAVTSAENMLLDDWNHRKEFGDLTVVYWAANGADSQYSDVVSALIDGYGNDTISNETLNEMMGAMAKGRSYVFDNLPLSPTNEFFVLGLTASGSRHAVRFFYRCKYGDMMNHCKQHFRDIDIIDDNFSPRWWASNKTLLLETVNQEADNPKPDPFMTNCFFDAMLFGGRYPEAMFNQVMVRIRAERKVSRGKAGMIKAYLIRNTDRCPNKEQFQEVATVALNETSDYVPYVLGRLFSVLEGVQYAANPDVGCSIKDRFFNMASATPALAFTSMMKLAEHHLKKIKSKKPQHAVYWSKQIEDLINRVDTVPARLNLQEQGAFMLGYYHQTQKRFEKKAADDAENTDNNEEDNENDE